ncbi:MAG: AI-2E family transporter [Actinomycetota bacterium]
MNDLGVSSAMPPWVRRAILFWWGILILIWAVYVTARELRSLLIQLVLALFLSFAMEPAVDRLGRYGIRRSAATLITMAMVIIFFVGFSVLMGQLVATQITQLTEGLPDYVVEAETWVEERFDIQIENEDLIAQLQSGGSASSFLTSVADNLVGLSTGLVTILFQALTIFLFAFYLTADGPALRQAICSVLPPTRQREVLRIWELAINKTGGFIASRVILAIISAIVHWIAFAALGLPSSIALAIWVGLISQFIPVVGVYIAGVVPALIALGIDPTKALIVVIIVVIYQQIENYGLQPRVTAQTLDMHPGVAFAAVLAGTATFGATGALLALPFLATVQSFISAYISRHDVVESRLLGQSGPVGATGEGELDLGPPSGDTPDSADERATAEHTDDGNG